MKYGSTTLAFSAEDRIFLMAFSVLNLRECFVEHVSADIFVFGGRLIFQPAGSFHGLIWDNILRVVAQNLGLASIAKNQREGAHLMAASLEGADPCISFFRTNNNNNNNNTNSNNNIVVILNKCRNTQF